MKDMDGKVLLWLSPGGEVEIAERMPGNVQRGPSRGPEYLPAWVPMTQFVAEEVRTRLCKRGYRARTWIYSAQVPPDHPEVLAKATARTSAAGLMLARFEVDVEKTELAVLATAGKVEAKA